MLFFPFLLANTAFLINVAAALLPALFLMRYVHRHDAVEKEPPGLLVRLALSGVAAGLLSMVLEGVGTRLLDATNIDPESSAYAIVMAFLVVALVEEGTKYFFLRRTWRNPAFNYRFDAIVYAVFVSLGFAGFENILYVQQFGLSVALPRALLSIPGHMSFAVVMGYFYGYAKRAETYGTGDAAKIRLTGYVLAVLLHGFYDACLMVGSSAATLLFVGFVIALYLFIFRLIRREAASDEPV